MADLSHQWGSDLELGPSGDLAIASGATLGQQRVLRRLLTNRGDYIWQLGYGAGLANFVGQPTNTLQIRSVIRSQMFKETMVGRSPEPIIDVTLSPGGTIGDVYVHIRYADSEAVPTQTLAFTVGR